MVIYLPTLAVFHFLSIVPMATEVVRSVADCNQFLLQETPPQVPGILEDGRILNQNRYKPICQTFLNEQRFVTLYDTKNKIPVFSAYKYRGGVGKRPRNDWKIEPQLEDEDDKNMKLGDKNKTTYNHQAGDTDYRHNGVFDRGHLFPSAHAFNTSDKMATFTLTNIVPQVGKFNKGTWSRMETCIKCVMDEYCNNSNGVIEGFVVTGAQPSANNVLKDRVNVPSMLWSAFCCYSSSMAAWLASAYWGDNVPPRTKHLETKTLEDLHQQLSTTASEFKVFPGTRCPLDEAVTWLHPQGKHCHCPPTMHPTSTSGPAASATSTPEPRTSTSGPRTSTSGPRTSTSGPRTLTSGPCTSTSRRRTSTSGPRTSTSGPRTYTSGPQTYTSGPQTYTSGPRTSTSAPRTSTSAPHTNTSGPHTNTSGPHTNTSGPHTSTSGPRTSTSAPHTSTSGPRTSTSGPRTSTSGPRTSTSGPRTSTSGRRTSTSGPRTSTSGPRTSTSGPRTSTSGPRTSTSGPQTYTSGPQTYTSGPQTYTSGPRTSTSAPHTSTSAPRTSTSAPRTSTSAPHTNTSAPHTNTSGPHTNTSGPRTSTSGPHTNTSAPRTSTSAPHTSTSSFLTTTSGPHTSTSSSLTTTSGPHTTD